MATASRCKKCATRSHLIRAVSTGCAGLDNILNGGFPRGRLYLIEGDPGAGKTTLALQFMREGVRKGERALYITLSESRADLAHAAQSHGLSLDNIEIVELLPNEDDLLPGAAVHRFSSRRSRTQRSHAAHRQRNSTGASGPAWSLMRSANCACWLKIPCATAARFCR